MIKALLLLTATLFVLQVETPRVGANSRMKFAFEWGAVDEDGNATAAKEVRFRLLRVNVTPPAPFAYGVSVPLVMTTAGTYEVIVSEVLKGRENGDWEVTMRVMDDAGNYSAYTDPPLLIQIVAGAPAAATDLRVATE